MHKNSQARVGQLFCAPLSWNEYRDTTEVRSYLSQVEELDIGGLILYGGDVETTPRLLKELQDRMDVPLLIMADLETGTAQQFKGGTEFPGMMAIGATMSSELSYRVGKATAMEAGELGVNVVLAPVLDVNTNPLNPIIGTRAFAEDPALVADLGTAYLVGCQETGAIATAKHFPGHGDTDIDSHISLPIIRRGKGSLGTLELPPFERAIREGVKSVMVGHIALPALTAGEIVPASMSRAIVTDLLRTELGFDGLVMTDAMIMGGVDANSVGKTAVPEAIRAGVDIIVYVDDLQGAINGVKSALGDGSLDSGVVEKAIQRIAAARCDLASRSGQKGGETGTVGCSNHRELAREVAVSSATLVRNRGDFLPISRDEKGLFVVYEDDDRNGAVDLIPLLRDRCPGWPLIALDRNVSELTGEQTERIRGVSKVILFVFTTVKAWRGYADLSPGGKTLLDGIIRRAERVGMVSLGSPFVMRHFPRIDGYLCLYSPSRVSQQAAIEAVTGDLSPSGRLPVSIPGLYPSGWGLSLEP
jgi:beta-glucosidase-like glycosyl hydrolase